MGTKWEIMGKNEPKRPYFLHFVYKLLLPFSECEKMRGFCEFDKKSIDKRGKILYNIVVKMPSRKPTRVGRLDANQNKEKTS